MTNERQVIVIGFDPASGPDVSYIAAAYRGSLVSFVQVYGDGLVEGGRTIHQWQEDLLRQMDADRALFKLTNRDGSAPPSHKPWLKDRHEQWWDNWARHGRRR